MERELIIWRWNLGQSAGGGSVVAQLLANGGNTKPQLFKNAILSSPYWPKFYRYDSPEAEEIYDTLVNLTGCAAPEITDSLKCLKGVDAQKIRDANQVCLWNIFCKLLQSLEMLIHKRHR